MQPGVWKLIAKTGAELWLPLPYHLFDTAGVMDYLVKEWLPSSVRKCAGMSGSEFKKAARLVALGHDLGKATPVFQLRVGNLCPEIREEIVRSGLPLSAGANFEASKAPHAHAGAELIRFLTSGGLEDDYGHLAFPDSVGKFAAVIGAHHGKPESSEHKRDVEENLSLYGENEWRGVQKELFDWALSRAGYKSVEELPVLTETAQVILTGLLIMADWIASNTCYFPLISQDERPESYDEERVPRALSRLNLPGPWLLPDDWRYGDLVEERFGFSANRVQQAVEKAAEEMSEPGIMILEAPMGEGKTEAALAAAEILINRFDLGGLAFFLPSQATSNAMFSRILSWAGNHPNAEHLSVQLMHAMAAMNEEFAALQEGSVQTEDEEQNPEEHLSVHSFFRGRKTGLLADLVVGTVDQLLMAALKQKHVMLRHLGLAGKAVIIDECHAYDAYMNVYLDRALQWLGAYHLPVILLSATLPGKRRAELLSAYTGNRKMDIKIAETDTYPLLTYGNADGVQMEPIAYEKPSRTVLIERAEEETIFPVLEQALSAGGCVGMILNTVRRAQEFAEKVRMRFPEAEVLMDHAQFLMPDRLAHEKEIIEKTGKKSDAALREKTVVIGTQVLEQSLDLDFDLMITDLCPMDLLMQRIGRLHRHPRKRPEGMETARCIVLNSDPEALENGAEAIYGTYLLKRTAMLLPEKIALPDDISPLVQKVYDEEKGEKALPEAYQEYRLDRGKRQGKAKGYCLKKARPDGSIIGLLDSMEIKEQQAQATVRDGGQTLEVLAVGLDRKSAVLLSGGKKEARIALDHQPSGEEAREIARQRLRLPARFSQDYNIVQTIEELEKTTGALTKEWQSEALIEGELFLFFDGDGCAELGGKTLHYDSANGLKVKEDTDAGQGI